jgi:glutamine synthetase
MITNQWINSYKRIATQNEAPSYKCWSNESTLGTLIRIPSRRKDSADSSRIEFRVPDPACNPYLSFAMMISSGLEGIKNKYELEPQIKSSIKDFSDKELKDLDKKRLPFNLGEAIQIAEKSSLLKNTIGKDAFEVYIERKKKEWQEYSESITDFEIESSINL